MRLRTQWLGGLRSDWDIQRPSSLFVERRQPSTESDTHLTPSQHYGVLPQTEYMAVTGNKVVLNLSGADKMKHVEPDDFVIHLRSFQGGIEHSRYSGKVSNAYTVIQPRNSIEPRYFKWVLKAPGFIQELSTTTEQLRDGQSIKFEQFAQIGLPVPPQDEQRRIADFLDEQVARIDKIAGARDLESTLINDWFDGALREAVLGTGSQSLGWADSIGDDRMLRPIGSVLQIRGEKNDPIRLTQVLSLTAARGVIRYEDKGDIGNKASEDISRYNIVCKGDLVMNSMNVIIGSVGLSAYDGVLSPVYYVLYPLAHSAAMNEFVALHFRIREFQRQLVKLGYGILDHRMRIPWVNLRTEKIALPLLDVQRKIVYHVSSIDGQRLKALAALESSQEKLDEYKRSLITAAVTGELDVTTARRGIPV